MAWRYKQTFRKNKVGEPFSIGRNVYGLLFHLEVTGQMVREWVATFKEELEGVNEYIRAEAIFDRLPQRIDELNRHARRLFAHFCESLR